MGFWDTVASVGLYMQTICTLLHTDNHARTPPLSFYRLDVLPADQPTVSKHRKHTINNYKCKKLNSLNMVLEAKSHA